MPVVPRSTATGSRAGRVGAVLAGLACVVACAAPGLLAAGTAGVAAAVGRGAGLLAAAVIAAAGLALVLALRRRPGCSDADGCSCSR